MGIEVSNSMIPVFTFIGDYWLQKLSQCEGFTSPTTQSKIAQSNCTVCLMEILAYDSAYRYILNLDIFVDYSSHTPSCHICVFAVVL